ncbi:MAG: hypothetical protein F6K47_33080 [Symploca sp. SIO2E6]|nr:hypothetical protein [Symploca sp. SIO2E6]
MSANFWCQSFLGKQLMTVWVCENDQGYRYQVILAFEYLHPSLIFVAEGSVITAFLRSLELTVSYYLLLLTSLYYSYS